MNFFHKSEIKNFIHGMGMSQITQVYHLILKTHCSINKPVISTMQYFGEMAKICITYSASTILKVCAIRWAASWGLSRKVPLLVYDA